MTLSIDDFRKADLITAKVLEVNEHPNADRLWVIKVDLGLDRSQEIVAGVRQQYTKEQLLGKTVILCANMDPAVIRGVKSEGMLLAAKSATDISVITTDREIPPGTKIS